MTAVTGQSHCLNCGEPAAGHFCANCGQRVIPAYPTVKDVVAEAWDELSGWDGRLMLTIRTLLLRPGELTRASAEGRRARHVRPLRVYLTASVLYFLIAAAAPTVTTRETVIPGDEDVKIDLDLDAGFQLTPEQRAQVMKNIEDAPPVLKPLLTRFVEDPAGFRRRMIEAMPRVFFVLVPVFAGILAMFYRGRGFPHHLIFALHLHSFVFLALVPVELSKFTGNLYVVITFQIAGWIAILWYGFRSLRHAYGESRLRTAAKALGLAVAYLTIWIPAIIAAIAWATLTR